MTERVNKRQWRGEGVEGRNGGVRGLFFVLGRVWGLGVRGESRGIEGVQTFPFFSPFFLLYFPFVASADEDNTKEGKKEDNKIYKEEE